MLSQPGLYSEFSSPNKQGLCFHFEVSDLTEVSFALVREVWTHLYLALHLGTNVQLAVLPTLP